MRTEFTRTAKDVAMRRQNERNDPYRLMSPDQLRKLALQGRPALDIISKAIPRDYICGTCGAPLDQNKQCRNSTADWPHR